MPYIKKDRRAAVDPEPGFMTTPGELNYAISQVIDSYLHDYDRVGYTQYNEVLGVLEALKLEIYRRLVAPYEDDKIEENGDVFSGRRG
jgi:hypothetical protein